MSTYSVTVSGTTFSVSVAQLAEAEIDQKVADAQAAASDAETALDSFDDRYLGSKPSAPTTDNDGDPLLEGALYWNSTSDQLFIWDGSAWSTASISSTDPTFNSVTATTADINGGTIDGATVDGRDVGTDGSKLDGIEANADVTDTANVTAAGALMDSELTDIAAVKALDQGVATTDSPSFAGADINGGTIDGTVIGGTTPAAISGTTGQFGTSLNVDGTITSDGLTVDGGSSSKITIESTNTSGEAGILEFYRTNASHAVAQIVDEREGDLNGGKLNFKTSDTSGSMKLRMDIDQGGDISFYEDTGTTPKFFWDASAESLGLGTTSPSGLLTVEGSVGSASISTGGNVFSFSRNSANYISAVGGSSAFLAFHTGSTNTDPTSGVSQRMVIDSSGNVGIGTSSPSAALSVINDKANTGADFGTFTDDIVASFEGSLDDKNKFIRIGNGRYANFGGTDAGIIFTPSGSNNGFYPTVIQTARRSSDTSSSAEMQWYLAETNTTSEIGLFAMAYGAFRPLVDNTHDLGSSSFRFDDVYATNPNINNSDRNEKQDIEELDEAEHRVALAAKGLLRKFRWKSAVAAKDDNPDSDEQARIHFGIIAQDLQAAFEAEGLDAGRYSMFISNTWWEAEETYTDDDGVEQTRTNTYDTAEEAPEGAVERTRLGVRYSELLAFIIGAM